LLGTQPVWADGAGVTVLVAGRRDTIVASAPFVRERTAASIDRAKAVCLGGDDR
jgi:hypothetical protein